MPTASSELAQQNVSDDPFGLSQVDTSLDATATNSVGSNPAVKPADTSAGGAADVSAGEAYAPAALAQQVQVLGQDDFHSSIAGHNLNFDLDPASTSKSSTKIRDNVLHFAEQFLGTPYVWGGSSPQGFDCSGFVQFVTKKFGLNMPRLSYAQAGAGVRTAMKDLQPGDLVAFSNTGNNGGADHIAIYVGHGQIIEAPHTGASVRIRTLGQNERYWGVHLNYPGEK